MLNKQLYPHSVPETSNPRLTTIALKPTDVMTKTSWRTFQFRLLQEQVFKILFQLNFELCAQNVNCRNTRYWDNVSWGHDSCFFNLDVWGFAPCLLCFVYFPLTTKFSEHILFGSRGVPLRYT